MINKLPQNLVQVLACITNTCVFLFPIFSYEKVGEIIFPTFNIALFLTVLI